MNCPHCKEQIPEDTIYCPNCGQSIKDNFIEVKEEFDFWKDIKIDSELEGNVAYKPKIFPILIICVLIIIGGIAIGMHIRKSNLESENRDTSMSPKNTEYVDKGINENKEQATDTQNNMKEDLNGNAHLYIKKVNVPLNIRDLPKHESDLVGTICDNTIMYYYGETEQGLGSDGNLHEWYKVKVDSNIEGWVRSDLIQKIPDALDQVRLFVKNVEGSLNLRELPQHKSNLVGLINDNTIMYCYGEVEQGQGSDGNLHDWYKVEVDSNLEGWVRSDLVEEVLLR